MAATFKGFIILFLNFFHLSDVLVNPGDIKTKKMWSLPSKSLQYNKGKWIVLTTTRNYFRGYDQKLLRGQFKHKRGSGQIY